MSGTPALTYATNVLFRCADFPSLHRMGKAYRFIFIGPEGTWLTIVAVNGGAPNYIALGFAGFFLLNSNTYADCTAKIPRAPSRSARGRRPF